MRKRTKIISDIYEQMDDEIDNFENSSKHYNFKLRVFEDQYEKLNKDYRAQQKHDNKYNPSGEKVIEDITTYRGYIIKRNYREIKTRKKRAVKVKVRYL